MVHGAQYVHAVGVGTRHIQVTRPGPGREQQLVVMLMVAVIEADAVTAGVDDLHAGAQAQVDIVLAIPLGGVHGEICQ